MSLYVYNLHLFTGIYSCTIKTEAAQYYFPIYATFILGISLLYSVIEIKVSQASVSEKAVICNSSYYFCPDHSERRLKSHCCSHMNTYEHIVFHCSTCLNELILNTECNELNSMLESWPTGSKLN